LDAHSSQDIWLIGPAQNIPVPRTMAMPIRKFILPALLSSGFDHFVRSFLIVWLSCQ
jgi:hypothetical protein